MADTNTSCGCGPISSSLCVKNVEVSTTTIPTVDLDFKSNYTMIDSPKPSEESRFRNLTSPVNADEIISYRSRHIDSVNTYNRIYYPARVTEGEEFGIRLDLILRSTTPDGVIVCDEPIVISLSFKAPMSSNVTEEVLEEVFQRLCSAKPAKGWNSLMLGGTNPLIG